MQLLDLIRMALFTLLMISSIFKWINLNDFRRTLQGLKLPHPLIQLAVWFIPLLELAIAVGYLNKDTVQVSIIAYIVLSLGFAWATYTGQKSGLRCNCFGNLSNERFGLISYVRIILLVILNLILFLNGANASTNLSFNNIYDLTAVALLSIGFMMFFNVFNVLMEYRRRKISDM